MERDALASAIIEVGPSGAHFKYPVLVEVPHFASLSSGSRELVVLRSDDGETWKEHEFNERESWVGPESDLYQDVVKKIDLNRAADDLDTSRVVRLSTMSFPKYFAVLSRIMGEVKSIGADGGTVEAKSSLSSSPVAVKFPANSLKKKIKIGLQLQEPDNCMIDLIDKERCLLDVYPLVGVYPRRRKFHHPIEVSVPVKNEARANEVKKIWILCSLSSASEKAIWEDVSESAAINTKGTKLVFESRVSALFWLFTAKKDISQDKMLDMAGMLYRELLLTPYLARLTIYYRRQFPFAWCDALR